MALQLALSTIRQADLPASEAWEILMPLAQTEDGETARLVFDALRSWTWKSLDRRRRDSNLREWVDILNRVEAFFADRFGALAAKIEVLVDLVHESLAVAELATSDELLGRKHVQSIMTALLGRGGGWIDRGALMRELGLKPANMTRLMTLLLDVGWAEQAIEGREASYRASAEGMARARATDRGSARQVDGSATETTDPDAELDQVRSIVASSLGATSVARKPGQTRFRHVRTAEPYSSVPSRKAFGGDRPARGRGWPDDVGPPRLNAYSPRLASIGVKAW